MSPLSSRNLEAAEVEAKEHPYKDIELAQELNSYPKLQDLAYLTLTRKLPFEWDQKVRNPRLVSICGSLSLVFKNPNAKTERWAGAILDELGYKSVAMNIMYIGSLRLFKNVSICKIEEELFAPFLSSSKNSIQDKYTGTGEKANAIVNTVWGICLNKETQLLTQSCDPKRVIKSLIFNDKEKPVVLLMISILRDIEDEMERSLPPVLVDIIREYYDWTDTGSERREIEKMISKNKTLNDLLNSSFLENPYDGWSHYAEPFSL